MTERTPQQTVQQYHRAWTSGDIETAMDLVADDVFCRAPGVDLHGKEAYREFIGGFAPMLTGVEDVALLAEGERIALFSYPQTAATSTTPSGELFTVREGRIVESILIFDRLSYGPPAS